jgi:hypothetical protein
MKHWRLDWMAVSLLALAATPVWAAGAGTAVPEPADFALFGVGLAGLVIGRFANGLRRRKKRDEDA